MVKLVVWELSPYRCAMNMGNCLPIHYHNVCVHRWNGTQSPLWYKFLVSNHHAIVTIYYKSIILIVIFLITYFLIKENFNLSTNNYTKRWTFNEHLTNTQLVVLNYHEISISYKHTVINWIKQNEHHSFSTACNSWFIL